MRHTTDTRREKPNVMTRAPSSRALARCGDAGIVRRAATAGVVACGLACVAALPAGAQAVAAPTTPTAVSPAFDRQAWAADYAALKRALEGSYANLAWFASPAGGVDLPTLDRDTRHLLSATMSDAGARAALRAFVAAFHDGHFSELPWAAPASAPAPPEPPLRALAGEDAASACAAMGYATGASPVAFSLPFESLPTFHLDADGDRTPFRAGVLTAAGQHVGVVRIKSFSQRQYPIACAEAWTASDSAHRADRGAFADAVTDRWFASLAAQLARFRTEGVTAVLVDVGANSGGNDSGDWAARLFTDRPIRSARVLMSAGSLAMAYLGEELRSVQDARTRAAGGSDPTTARLLDRARRALDAWTAHAGASGCDMAWVWREQRAWAPADSTGCSRLTDVGWASGAIAALAPGEAVDRRTASTAYWPATVEPWRGSWTGPTYVLTDARTYSSAEMFAAVLQDNHAATLVGDRTGGDGCGFLTAGAPVVLPHSRLRFRLPNCVRLRADGSDEVAGVMPTLPVVAREGESARARAVRVLTAITTDVAGPTQGARP